MPSQKGVSYLWDFVVECHRHHGLSEASSQRETLRRTAQETRKVLPDLLGQLDSFSEALRSKKVSSNSLPCLNPHNCPRFSSPATIKVINDDTLNVAIGLAQYEQPHLFNPRTSNPRPVIVNFANHRKPGGGWLNGAMAQEESICYRSSLSLSLKSSDYPLALDELIYSPYILIMRSDLDSGHTLLESPSATPQDLPVVSGITIAAVHQPALHKMVLKDSQIRQGGHDLRPRRSSPSSSPSRQCTQQGFARERDRKLTKDKMRLVLRTAALNGHQVLVLGALGCGVYANPPAEIAKFWLEVLRDNEFGGNWWREVYFAVYDSKNEGTFETFKQVLDGEAV